MPLTEGILILLSNSVSGLSICNLQFPWHKLFTRLDTLQNAVSLLQAKLNASNHFWNFMSLSEGLEDSVFSLARLQNCYLICCLNCCLVCSCHRSGKCLLLIAVSPEKANCLLTTLMASEYDSATQQAAEPSAWVCLKGMSSHAWGGNPTNSLGWPQSP